MIYKRWNNHKQEYDVNKKIDKFLSKVVEMSRKYGLSIAHEDGGGAFVIEKLSEENINWLQHAHDGTGEE